MTYRIKSAKLGCNDLAVDAKSKKELDLFSHLCSSFERRASETDVSYQYFINITVATKISLFIGVVPSILMFFCLDSNEPQIQMK